MIVDPFPELSRSAVVHVRTDVFSDSRAPFVHQTVLGLTPYFRNLVLATDFDCEVPDGIITRRMDRREMYTPGWAYRLANEIRRSVPDVIAVVGHFGNGMRIGFPLAAALNVPVLGIFGGSDVNVEVVSENYRQRYLDLFSDPDSYFLTVASYLADKLIASGAPEERTFPWRRGVDLSLFDPPSWTERQAMPGPIKIAMAGRFIEVKGHEYALRGFAEPAREFPQLELDLYGDGPGEDAMRALAAELGIADKVRFCGHVTRLELIKALNSVQIGMLTSVQCGEGRSEGIPNVLVEAQAMALPVVATTNGGIRETVADRKTGFLVAERDPQALAGALKRLASDAQLRSRMGEAARRHVEESFDRDVQARRLAAKIHHMGGRAALRCTRTCTMDSDDPSAVREERPVNTEPATTKRPTSGNRGMKALANQELSSYFREPLVAPEIEQPRNPILRLKWTYIQVLSKLVFQPYFNSSPGLFFRRLTRVTELLAEQTRLSTQMPEKLQPRAGASTVVAAAGSDPTARPWLQTPQYMHVAHCEDCPHCPRSKPWPVQKCPMDVLCLRALESEYARRPLPSAPILQAAATLPTPWLELTDADLPEPGRLKYADNSFAAVHCRGHLQRVEDIPALLGELRRILYPDGYLLFTVWPLFQGAAGGQLLGEVIAPFAHRLFARDVLMEYLGTPPATPRELDPQKLDEWIRAAGLVAGGSWQPDTDRDPCSLEFQSRFGAALRGLGRSAAQLRCAYVTVLRPVA